MLDEGRSRVVAAATAIRAERAAAGATALLEQFAAFGQARQ